MTGYRPAPLRRRGGGAGGAESAAWL